MPVCVDRLWVLMGASQYSRNRSRERRLGMHKENVPRGQGVAQKRGFGKCL